MKTLLAPVPAYLAALALALSALSGCQTFGGLTRLEAMSDAEFQAYALSWEMRFERVTEAAIAEENLSTDEALQIASVVEAVASGTLAATISETLNQLDIPARGWAALLAWEAIYELDAELLGWDAYQAKLVRVRPLLLGVTRGIRAGAGVPPGPEPFPPVPDPFPPVMPEDGP